jgi:hypothetical protein
MRTAKALLLSVAAISLLTPATVRPNRERYISERSHRAAPTEFTRSISNRL